MIAAEFRALALSLPESEEKSHFGQPDFRVRNKIFATLNAEGSQGAFKLPREVQEMLLDARGSAFTPAAGAWGKSGWTHVHLARARPAEARVLLVESFRLVAPPNLAASVAEGAPPPRKAPPAKKAPSKSKKKRR
jgi:hypothetical protein